MKKVIVILISCIMLISNVMAYNSYDKTDNEKLNTLSVEDPDNEIRNYTFYAILKYMGFNLPSVSMYRITTIIDNWII